MARLVVIGGGAAGMSAASAARRVAPELDVVVCEAGGFAAYGICGIPYFLGGTVPRAENLLAYPPSEFRDHRGIDLRLHTAVSAIDASAHQVHLAGEAGSGLLGYDALVVATGASPVRPPVPGLDGPRVFTIRSLDDAIGLRRLLEGGTVRRAIVVGAGYIGLETAEALVCAGIEVEVVEALPRVLGNVDGPIAGLARAELERHTRLRLCTRLDAVHPGGTTGSLTATVNGADIGTDLVVIATGVRPTTDLLIGAGAGHLADRSVLVDPGMRTSLPDVFAAGDCVALPHLVLGGPAWVPLGPAANKTGRVAGTVAAGGAASFPGIVGTAVVKVFDLEVARTGLTLAEAQAADLAGLDLSYAPPFAPVYDPVLAAAIKAAQPAPATNGPAAASIPGGPA